MRELLAPFFNALTGRYRWIHLGFLAIAGLFLVYLLLVKDPFMKGQGYQIPSLLSGELSAGKRRVLLNELKAQKDSLAEESQDLVERLGSLEEEVVRDKEAAPRRARARHYLRYAGWFGGTFFVLFLIPVGFIALHPRLRLADYGLGLGDLRYSGKILLLCLGVMLLAVLAINLFDLKGFLRFYPMFAEKGITGPQAEFGFWFLVVEICFLLYFIGWEFFFRGLLVFPLSRQIGSLAALIGVVPFAIMHAGKPAPEAFGSILAAWILGLIVIRARSFWVCPILHFAIAFAMDLTAAVSRNLF